MEMLQTLSERR